MAELQPVSEKSIDDYGGNLTPWSDVPRLLEEHPATPGQTYWLATSDRDGRPHVMPVGALWIEGAFYFTSGPGTRKARNLAINPHCVISAAVPGLDLVVEGKAEKVTDEARVQHLAEIYSSHGWPATAQDGAFTAPYSAPSAGPPPWHVYEVRPVKAFGLGTADPYGATRWEF